MSAVPGLTAVLSVGGAAGTCMQAAMGVMAGADCCTADWWPWWPWYGGKMPVHARAKAMEAKLRGGTGTGGWRRGLAGILP